MNDAQPYVCDDHTWWSKIGPCPDCAVSDPITASPGVNFYITQCIHGLDLRLYPRCYLCKPEIAPTIDIEHARSAVHIYQQLHDGLCKSGQDHREDGPCHRIVKLVLNYE